MCRYETPSTTTSTTTIDKPRPFSTFVTACFTLNYVMGTGILALPWAFRDAGVLLTCASLVVVCVVAIVTVDYLLTAMARAGAVAEHLSRPENRNNNEQRLSSDSETTSLLVSAASGDRATAVVDEDADAESGRSAPVASSALLEVGERRFEYADLCREFLGRRGERAFAASIALTLYGVLWTYAAVFGKAAAYSLPVTGLGASGSYCFYVGVFACIVVPLSFQDLTEQVSVQVFLSTCRFVMILVLIATPLAVAYLGDDGDGHGGRLSFGGRAIPEGYHDDGALWDPSGLPAMLPAAMFSVVFHSSVPGLAMEVENRRDLHRVFGLTLVLCITAYAAIGIVDSWFFGLNVEQSVNLNWAYFRYDANDCDVGGDDENHQCPFSWGGWAASVVSFYTVAFPAVDVVSAFPLNAIVLSSNLRTALGGDETRTATTKTTTARRDDRRVFWFKLVSCVPPIVGSLFVGDLGTIADFAGLLCFALGFCFPALLYVRSERRMTELGLTTVRTRYERFGSSTRTAKGIFVFGTWAALYTGWQYVKQQRR